MTCYHELHQLEAVLPDFRLLRAADQGIGLLKDGLIARARFCPTERGAGSGGSLRGPFRMDPGLRRQGRGPLMPALQRAPTWNAKSMPVSLRTYAC